MASETACTYACLVLNDDVIAITLCEKRNIEELLLNVGVGGGGAAPAFLTAAASGDANVTAAPAAEEKKEEPKDEIDDDNGLLDLFD